MADRFYTAEPLGAGSFVLTGPEAHHLATVRRFVPGDRVTLFNGDGVDYPALVLSADKREVLLDVHAGVAVDREPTVRVEIAAALPKGDRGDFLVEKLTELGVAKFTPLVTDRTVVQPKDGRRERFNRAVIEASKQCGRAVLMEVGLPAEWTEYLRATWLPAERWVMHTTAADLFPPPLWGRVRVGGSPESPPPQPFPVEGKGEERPGIVAAVGPEGGFTDEEVSAATAAGWRVGSLGPRVLRVETAAVAAAVLAVSSPAGPAFPARP